MLKRKDNQIAPNHQDNTRYSHFRRLERLFSLPLRGPANRIR